ncbi:SGNH hydrolase-type esterase domain-containing protein [Tricladium varicosporioides]|nr:SGNH hydrolase-type esterase domain-containing protein [Hymenoscyphus varicosporioides]
MYTYSAFVGTGYTIPVQKTKLMYKYFQSIGRASNIDKCVSNFFKMASSSSTSSVLSANINDLIKAHMKFKARSHETHTHSHIPELTSLKANSMKAVLIGDSMLERLKTTGFSTELCSSPNTFNAGVGGDKIENLLYRLDLGLLKELKKHEKSLRVVVLMVGTNNLGKKGIKDIEAERYGLLLAALLGLSDMCKVLCCEVFKRKDISDEAVGTANGMLKGLVEWMNGEVGKNRVIWVPAPETITMQVLEDHVHLGEEGYRLWDEALYPRLRELLEGEVGAI